MGVEEIWVGEIEDGQPESREGGVFAFSGADHALLWEFRAPLEAELENTRVGHGLEFLEDVNGDGLDEVLVGLPGANQGVLPTGAVEVRNGFDGRSIVRLDSPNSGHVFGQSVVRVGDTGFVPPEFTTDGLEQFAVGAPRSSISGTGIVYFAGLDPFLTLEQDTLSADGVDEVVATVDFPEGEVGKNYTLLIAKNGFDPPTMVGTTWVPLASPDPILDVMLAGNLPPGFDNILENHAGTLDENGDAEIRIRSKPALQAEIGSTFYFSVVSMDAPASSPERLSSVMRTLQIVP